MVAAAAAELELGADELVLEDEAGFDVVVVVAGDAAALEADEVEDDAALLDAGLVEVPD